MFVIGSYFLAQEIKVKRPRRQATTAPRPRRGAAPRRAAEDATEAEPVSRLVRARGTPVDVPPTLRL